MTISSTDLKEKKNQGNNLEDIYDGRVYRKLWNSGFLSCGDNISFLMNTDGIPVFKSSKISIWPLYLCINELQYKKKCPEKICCSLGFGLEKKSLPCGHS